MDGLTDTIDFPGETPSFSVKTTYHIYFIPGNPGLVSYYTTFLTLLHKALSSATSSSLPKNNVSIAIHGESLGGFELADINAQNCTPLSLQRQIAHVETRIFKYCEAQPSPVKIILMGHSVGAYIALEILRRHRISSHSSSLFQVVSAILLFPTVTHIAASPSGLKTAWLLRMTYLPQVMSYLVHGLAWTLGKPTLETACRVMLGMTDEAAATTAAFLGSEMGVKQALYMARDEMDEITEDKWDDDLWASSDTMSNSECQPTKLFLLFGRADHWVANHTRDELIASRGLSKSQSINDATGRPLMEIDEAGIPHGFCIRHNEPVALKVQEYIEELAQMHMRQTPRSR